MEEIEQRRSCPTEVSHVKGSIGKVVAVDELLRQCVQLIGHAGQVMKGTVVIRRVPPLIQISHAYKGERESDGRTRLKEREAHLVRV